MNLSEPEKKDTFYNEETIKYEKLINILKNTNLENTTPLQAFKILEKALSLI